MMLDYGYLKNREEIDVYGITFDLDTHILEDEYGISRTSAYATVSRELEKLGFKHLQYSVYVCPEYKNELLLIYHVVNSLKKYEWFNAAVHDIIAFKLDIWSEITEAFKE